MSARRQCCEWLDRGMRDGVPTVLCKNAARFNIVIRSRGLATNAGDYCTLHMRKHRKDYQSRGYEVTVRATSEAVPRG